MTDLRNSDRRLDVAIVRRLSQRSLLRSLSVIAFQWAVIVACITVAHHSASYLVLALALVVIASRQHALAVFAHEASHFNLCKSRTLNDVLGNLFCAFPLSLSVRRYRRNHLAHHRLLNGHDDPDIVENTPPDTLLKLAGQILMDLCFLSLAKNYKRSRKFGVFAIFREKGEGWRTERWLYGALVATVVVSATVLHGWALLGLYWFAPQFSILQVLTRLRGYADHGGRLNEADDHDKSRTVEANLIEQFLFAPCSVNRHLEHHLYPSVPFYNLERLHQAMQQNEGSRPRLQTTLGYLRFDNFARSAFGEMWPKRNPAENTGSMVAAE